MPGFCSSIISSGSWLVAACLLRGMARRRRLPRIYRGLFFEGLYRGLSVVFVTAYAACAKSSTVHLCPVGFVVRERERGERG